MMAGHYSAAPQDRPPSMAAGFLLTSSFRLSIYSSVHLSHRPGVYRASGSNYDVEVRGGWVHRRITVIIVIIRMIYHYYSVFIQQHNDIRKYVLNCP